MGAGLTLADRELSRITAGGTRSIILLTDGHSNSGRDPEVVANIIKEKEIQLDIIGIGGSPEEVDEPLLRRMASVMQGQQRYWFIRSVGELVQRFEALALREFR
jgi:predicted metal-dependent phosphotriesterase family hydrolase